MKLTREDLIDKTRESMAFTSGFQSKGPSRRNRNFESKAINDDEADTFERDENDIDGELAAEHKRIMQRMQRGKQSKGRYDMGDVTHLDDNDETDGVLFDDDCLE